MSAIRLRIAGIENSVKYAILRVRMSLCLCLCTSENQAKGIINFFSSVTFYKSCKKWLQYMENHFKGKKILQFVGEGLKNNLTVISKITVQEVFEA